MPRIDANRYRYQARDMIRELHGALLARGVRDVQVADWLNCTSQNVGRHFKNGSFTLEQFLTIRGHLEEMKEAES